MSLTDLYPDSEGVCHVTMSYPWMGCTQYLRLSLECYWSVRPVLCRNLSSKVIEPAFSELANTSYTCKGILFPPKFGMTQSPVNYCICTA